MLGPPTNLRSAETLDLYYMNSCQSSLPFLDLRCFLNKIVTIVIIAESFKSHYEIKSISILPMRKLRLGEFK